MTLAQELWQSGVVQKKGPWGKEARGGEEAETKRTGGFSEKFK